MSILSAFTSGHYPPGMSQGDFDRAFDELGPEDDAEFPQHDNDDAPEQSDDLTNERPLTRAEFEDYDYWRDMEEQ